MSEPHPYKSHETPKGLLVYLMGRRVFDVSSTASRLPHFERFVQATQRIGTSRPHVPETGDHALQRIAAAWREAPPFPNATPHLQEILSGLWNSSAGPAIAFESVLTETTLTLLLEVTNYQRRHETWPDYVGRISCDIEAPTASAKRWQAELEAVARETAEANWDGYGAKPVDRGSIAAAREFLGRFDADRWPPDIGAEPDGDVTVEWCASARKRLSASVDRGGRITFVALLGDREHYGVETISDDGIRAIRTLVEQVFGN